MACSPCDGIAGRRILGFVSSQFAIDVPKSLIERGARGDMRAFEQIYRLFERPVYTLALRMLGDADEAQEILHDAMLQLFRKLGQFRGDAPFWGWLRQIAVNEALMALRRRRRSDDEDANHADATDWVDDRTPPPPAAADAACLQRALSVLPANTRTVLWLYHAEGYTHDEIAALMQKTPSFSKSQLARGTRRLRELLEPTALPLREAAHG
jgi:RNA polymerase sigma factor (sigma-70 family)